MPNLLTRVALDEANDLCQFYAVLDGKDYRISLATMLTLVTKAKIGLGRVDNTSDEEKPVSIPVQSALDNKADKDSTATKDALDQLALQLESYVSQATLDQAVQNLTDLINSQPDEETIAAMIAQSIQGVVDGYSQLEQAVISHQQQLTQIQQAGYVTNTSLNELMMNLSSQMEEIASGRDVALKEVVDLELSATNQRITELQTILNSLTNDYGEHVHTPDQITGLEEFITNLIGAGSVGQGSHQW